MNNFDIQQFLAAALAEDIGAGDITSNAVIPAGTPARFSMNARQPLVVAGLNFVPMLFGMLDEEITVTLHTEDGTVAGPGAKLATLEGPAHGLLAGERTALNLVQHLSGVATLARQYVEAVAGTPARIVDTRKTLPGWRSLQKYAVRCGGAYNHRLGLSDGVLIKDNHLAVAGSITNAVLAAKSSTPLLTKIEVECDTLAQLDEALAVGVDMVLLDNMDLIMLAEGVRRAHAKGVQCEASGNVSLETVCAIAETGVDVISVGKITHSAIAVDIGLDEA